MRQTGNGQRQKSQKSQRRTKKNRKSEKPKSQNDTKTKFKNKGAHKIGATQASPHRTALRYCGSERSRQSDLQWPQNSAAAAPHTHIHIQARSKKNNKILFSRLLTLTLTASKSYEPYSLSLPAVPRQKLSLTAWPHKMPSYIQSLPRVPKKKKLRERNNNNINKLEWKYSSYRLRDKFPARKTRGKYISMESREREREPSRDRERERER